MSGVISVLQAGKMLGVSHTAVQVAIKAQRLVKSVVWINGKPKIDPELVVAEWLKNTDQGLSQLRGNDLAAKAKANQLRVPSKTKSVPPTSPAPSQVEKSKEIGHRLSARVVKTPPPPPPAADDTDPRRPDLNTSKSVQALYAARLAKLEYEQKAGKVVPVDAVKMEAFRMARTVRDAILNVPERLAPMVAAESSPSIVYNLLVKELTLALTALAGEADDNQSKTSKDAA